MYKNNNYSEHFRGGGKLNFRGRGEIPGLPLLNETLLVSLLCSNSTVDLGIFNAVESCMTLSPLFRI